jgi:hypothetical protein
MPHAICIDRHGGPEVLQRTGASVLLPGAR